MQIVIPRAVDQADRESAVFDMRREGRAGKPVLLGRLVAQDAVHPALTVGGDDNEDRGRLVEFRSPRAEQQALGYARRSETGR